MRIRPLRLALLALAAITVIVLLVVSFQERIIFPGSMLKADEQAYLPKPAESLWIDGDNGAKVEAFFFPGRGRSAQSPGPALIYTHGNFELADDNLRVADFYNPLGISVLIVEYRGYGRSTGSPGEAAIGRDMLKWRELLLARPEVDPARVVYHGRSLGGGVAAHLAAVHPPAALILESTFTSIDAKAASLFVPSFLLRHHFRTDRVLSNLAAPILVLHGTQDEVVPVSHGRALSKLRPGIVYFEGEGGHNDFPRPEGREAYQRAIIEHLRSTGLLDGLQASGEP